MILEKFFVPMKNLELPLPQENVRMAIFFAEKNIVNLVWNTLTVLENNPTTLPQTAIILNGRSVSGLSLHHLMQVKHFGESFRFLLQQIKNNTFAPTLKTAKKLHFFCGKEEALEWGVIRKHQVEVNCQYIPPSPEGLIDLIKAGLSELQDINDPVEQALNTFAFMSKTQPFYDANKRTATLLMNGILLSAGLYPLFVPVLKEEDFAKSLRILYESGESRPLMQFFTQTVEQLYPENGGYGPRRRLILNTKKKICILRSH